MQAPHALSKRHDTAASFDGMLVVFSSVHGTLNVFCLECTPPSLKDDPLREPLEWGSCAMSPAPPPKPLKPPKTTENSNPNAPETGAPAASAAAAAAQGPEASRMWQKGDLQPSGMPELGSAALRSAVCTVSKAPGEILAPQSCDLWSSLCVDAERNRCCSMHAPHVFDFESTGIQRDTSAYFYKLKGKR
jgi:hypothetical protein